MSYKKGKQQTGYSNKVLKPKNQSQRLYIESIQQNLLTFGVGPSGTGKTYLAAHLAAQFLESQEVDKFIVIRPAVATEDLGFLPGKEQEKLDPYFKPIREVLISYYNGAGTVKDMLKNEVIEITALAYLRGRTFYNSFVLLDEAQNVTAEQMKLFLTRIGLYSKIVVNGDLEQKDIYGVSGLETAIAKLKPIIESTNSSSMGKVEFSKEDSVRSPLVKQILRYWD